MPPIISVEKLGKRYLVGHQSGRREQYTALRDVIARNAREWVRKTRDVLRGRQIVEGDEQEEFWALKDVSFDVQAGECVGIIGRNGAGKSTLLKILSRITEPTEGRVTLRGRVASLLEVGTGFHLELTGRENVYLNGAILGMTRVEIRKKFDEIVAFAEVEKFLDTPVKRYSSGMYVRLAFAVAAHLEPEILIVDEVLAVGDAQFQKKCLGKMQDVTGKGGRTVLFVSHNMSAVRTLCGRGICLEAGSIRFAGRINEAVDSYVASSIEQSGAAVWSSPTNAPGDDALRLRAVRIRSEGEVSASAWIDREIQIEIEYETLKPGLNATVSFHLHSQGTCAFVGGPASTIHNEGTYCAVCTIPGNLLNDGVYSVTVFLITDTTNLRVIKREVVSFSVHDRERSEYLGKIIGMVRPQLSWNTASLSGRTHA
jgi:lipopolysaccharide transport system ATP-binding protein